MKYKSKLRFACNKNKHQDEDLCCIGATYIQQVNHRVLYFNSTTNFQIPQLSFFNFLVKLYFCWNQKMYKKMMTQQ